MNTDDVLIEKKGRGGFELLEGNKFITLLNINLTEELKQEGLVREFIRAVQTYRKELNLPVELRVDLFVQAEQKLQQILVKSDDLLQKNLILNEIHFKQKRDMKKFEIEDDEVYLFIC